MTFYNYRKIVKESLPFMIFLLILSWTTGDLWETFARALLDKYFVIFILLPGYISAIGSIGSVFVSRLTSHTLLGELNERFEPYHLLITNILGLMFSGVLYFTGLALVGNLMSFYFLLPINPLRLYIILLSSGLISVFCIMIFGMLVTFIAYKQGLDPDNFASPLMSNLGDLLGSFFLVVFTVYLL